MLLVQPRGPTMKEHRIKRLPVQRIEAGYSLCSLLNRQEINDKDDLLPSLERMSRLGYPKETIWDIMCKTNLDHIYENKCFACLNEQCCCSRVPHHPLFHIPHPVEENNFRCCCLISTTPPPDCSNLNNDEKRETLEKHWKKIQETLILNPNGAWVSVSHLENHYSRAEVFVTLGRTLLERGAFTETYQLIMALLHREKSTVDPNTIDNKGQSLLSYAVGCANDKAADAIRALLNSGANVWVTTEKQSPFTCFLKTIIRRGSLNLDQCGESLNLLCLAMSSNPKKMHSHVMQTMFNNARNYKILGPVFYELKHTMAHYWKDIPELKVLARAKFRNEFLNNSQKRLNHTTLTALGFPKALRDYILLY